MEDQTWNENASQPFYNVEWNSEPFIHKAKKAKKSLEAKYINKAEKKKARLAGNFKYTPNLKPAKIKGLTIKNGIDPSDTVIIATAIHYKGRWHTWKVGFHPSVSNEFIRFHFDNGEKRKLRYKNVWQFIQDNYIGKETPDEDYYLDCNTRFFKVPFPALEAFDNNNGGAGEIA